MTYLDRDFDRPDYLRFNFAGDDNPSAQIWARLEAGESLDGLDVPAATIDMVRADYERYVAAVASQRRQYREQRIRECGIPAKDLARIIAGDLIETAAVKHARHALSKRWTLTILSGPIGVGKTVAAGLWLAGQAEAHDVFFIDAHRLQRANRYDRDQMSVLEKTRALALDDLGLELNDKSGAFRSLLDGLLNLRYAEQRPTLITTNCNSAKFRERYGERIIDRVKEAGAFLSVDGPSLRGAR